MAMELHNRCPICLDSWEEASYVMPCLHQFCYGCILRWAQSKPECAICKGRIHSIIHSVQGDDDFQEHVISPPAAPSVVTHLTGAPGHRDAHNLRGSAASQPSAVRLVPRAPVGGLHPHVWALLFRQHPVLFRHLVLWLRYQLRRIFEGARREAASVQRLLMSSLRLFGLDEEALCQLLWAAMGPHTSSFVRRLIDTVVARCSNEAQRWMGLRDNWAAEEREGSPEAAPSPSASQRGSPAPSPAPFSSPDRSEAEWLPSTSSAALRGGPSSTCSVPGHAASQRGSPAPSPAPSINPERSAAEELPSTSSAALRGVPSSTRSVPGPTHGDPEEPRENPEEPREDAEEAGPMASTPIEGSPVLP